MEPPGNATSSESYLEEELQGAVIVTRHLGHNRRYGYAICAIYCILCGVVTYLVTAPWSQPLMRSYWTTMAAAAAIDVLVLEWLYIGLTWMYRWMTGDTDDGAGEIHPYEGEEVVRL